MPDGPLNSRQSSSGAGWACQTPGGFRELMPGAGKSFSWLPWVRPATLWESRNDRLARWFEDPSNEQRRRWVERQKAAGAPQDFIVDRTDLDEPSFLLMGDTGEGDASQYAVVPGLLRSGTGTDFMIIASDVIYPAGEASNYEERFYRPYRDYGAPVYAIPGNHDWYDGLAGFMRAFCSAESPPPAPQPPRLFSRERLRSLLWREAPPVDEAAFERGRALRGAPDQQRGQPGPYWAIDTGRLRLIGIDTGITGLVDREQGEWLRRVSRGSDKAKILVTGKPLYVDGQHRPGEIDGGGRVDEIVRDPANRYVAGIGGDIHNYQRYPVDVGDGRTIQYIVAGGGGAFMHATHKIPRVELPGCGEEAFRCYPLRGDSLSFYSLAYDRRLAGGKGRLFIAPDEAAAIMAKRLDIAATRPAARDVTPSARAERAAATVFPLPGRGRGPWHEIFSEFFDWNEPPMFKSFLRLDVRGRELRIRCFAATGCREQEEDPPVEDEVRIALTE
jgi:hypothetical protein